MASLSLKVQVSGVAKLAVPSTNWLGCIRVDFGSQTGTASEECSAEDLASMHLEAIFELPEGQDRIEAVANTPMSVRLFHCQKVEKKKKVETHLQELACGSIDLYPLLASEDSVSVSLKLKPDTDDESTEPAEAAIVVTSTAPIMQEDDFSGRVLTLLAPTVCALPDTWASSSATYTLTVPLPQSSGPDRMVSFSGGTPASMPVQRSDEELKAAVGDYCSASDRAFRIQAETDQPAIAWGAQVQRVFLDKDALGTLEDRLSTTRLLAAHLKQVTVATGKGAKSRAGKEDEETVTCHAIAYVDASSLLYPGQSGMTGAFRLVPYNETEYLDRTKLAKAASLEVPSSKSSKKKDAKKDKESTEGGVDANAQALEVARTYLSLDVSVSQPLVEKRTMSDMVDKVKELIPERAPGPSVEQSAKRAVSAYHDQVKSIAKELLADFRTVSGEDDSTDTNHHRRKLTFALNESGKYFAFKEQLKRSVIRVIGADRLQVVREKFQKTETVKDPAERRQFLSALYAYLADEMHSSLNETFKFNRSEVQTAPVTPTVEQYKQFASEAEALREFETAATYHKDCIAKTTNDVNLWFDYGAFCMRMGDTSRAEECFREAVSINSQHVPSLLMCAAMALNTNNALESRVFLEAATTIEPEMPVAWLIRGLISEKLGDSAIADMAFKQADQCSTETLNLEAAQLLLSVNMLQLTDRILAREIVNGNDSIEFKTLQAQLLIRQANYSTATEVLESTLKQDYNNPQLWALQGDLHFQQGHSAEALHSYQHALDLPGEYPGRSSTVVRTASLYLNDEEYEEAKRYYIEACTAHPSALSWKGVGIACYRLSDLGEAEDALSESNIYDNRDGEVWLYLSLICVRTRRLVEAEQTYKYGIRAGGDSLTTLVDELRLEQEEAGFGNPFVDEA